MSIFLKLFREKVHLQNAFNLTFNLWKNFVRFKNLEFIKILFLIFSFTKYIYIYIYIYIYACMHTLSIFNLLYVTVISKIQNTKSG